MHTSPKPSMPLARLLFLGFSAVLLLLIVVAGSGWYAKHQLNQKLQTVYEDRTVPLEQLGDILIWSQRDRVLVQDMLLNPEPANIEKRSTEITKNRAAAKARWAEYMSTYLTPEEKIWRLNLTRHIPPISNKASCPQQKRWSTAKPTKHVKSIQQKSAPSALPCPNPGKS